MPNIRITREEFLKDFQGRTFADVVNDPEQPFDRVLQFFNQADRQRRMEESELHHNRSPLAGVVRELESVPEIDSEQEHHDVDERVATKDENPGSDNGVASTDQLDRHGYLEQALP